MVHRRRHASAKSRPFHLETPTEDRCRRGIHIVGAHPIEGGGQHRAGRAGAAEEEEATKADPGAAQQDNDHDASLPRARSPVRNLSGDEISLILVSHQKATAKVAPTTVSTTWPSDEL